MKRDRKQGLGLAVGLAVLTIVLVTTDDRADGLRPTQPMHDPKMPDPPRQSQTWTPPKSALPRFLVKATATLFEQGMPDPRGCEYRSVELAGESDLYKNPATPRPVTHAWVLPGEANGPRYAVAWNGLIYPLTAIGDAADLEADVRAIVAAVARAHAEHDARAKQTLTAPWRSGWSYLYDASVGNLQTASQEGLTPLKVCFLLRLGRADLAEILWEAGTGQKPQGEQRDLTPYGVSYLTLASDWTWALFDRAVDAHSRADDLLALTSAWEVARIRPIIEAKAEAMGFPRRQGFVQAGSSPSYLDFLKELPALLADQERRAREPKREPQRLAVIEKIPDPSKRIAALIDRLDEMGMRDSMGFRPQSDENVKALIREGNGAINPLLDTLEHDERLTRSYSSDERHRTRFRHLVPVYATAYSALVEIIGTSLFRPDSYATIFVNEGPEKRQEMAATIRTYVERFRGLSTEERSYRILADDRASSRQWLEAASQLSAPVKPVVVRVLDPRRPFGRPRVHYGEKVALHGDGLRNQKAPSVTELMVRRLDDLARPDYPWKQGDASPLYTACELALDLARWDSAAARPALKSLVNRCLREISGETQSRISYDPGSLGDFVARITDARSQLGDLDGLNAYAAWLRTISPDKMTYHIDSIFVPMEDNPHHSATAATAEWLFNDPASPWSTLQGDPKKPNDWYVHDRLIGRPMIGVAGFRRSLLRALNDRSEFGKASLKEGALVYQLKSGGSGSGGLTYIDPDGPRSTPETSVRFCDYYAWRLTTAFDGIPTCMLYWPEDRRDRAIAAQAAFLKQLGERFDASPLYDEVPGRLGFHRIPPVFPTMDHPATAEDVRRGAGHLLAQRIGPGSNDQAAIATARGQMGQADGLRVSSAILRNEDRQERDTNHL